MRQIRALQTLEADAEEPAHAELRAVLLRRRRSTEPWAAPADWRSRAEVWTGQNRPGQMAQPCETSTDSRGIDAALVSLRGTSRGRRRGHDETSMRFWLTPFCLELANFFAEPRDKEVSTCVQRAGDL
jgi:hypothetical protein